LAVIPGSIADLMPELLEPDNKPVAPSIFRPMPPPDYLEDTPPTEDTDEERSETL
jgi:hypothetical protein